MLLPVEIINKILVYLAEMNNNMMIMQYNLITNIEYYKINFCSNFLCKIKASLLLKRYYPLYSYRFFNSGTIELYKSAIKHYTSVFILNANIK